MTEPIAMSCPTDGNSLLSIDVEGAPPWLCALCSRAWFDAELTETARRAWNPLTRDHGTEEGGKAVREASEAEDKALKDAREKAKEEEALKAAKPKIVEENPPKAVP